MSPERRVLRLARPYLGRLLLAGVLAAGTELAGLALMATATWLLITAAGQPPVAALTVAIVSVRALAIGRGVLRYTERLAGHDAVLRIITEVRARAFATLAGRREQARSGDALSRLVSDVDAVQDLLLRVLVPGAAASAVGVLALAGATAISLPAALALAGGLLVAGVALPAAATALTRRTADRVAPLRAALAADAIDLTHGAADLAAFGATGTALDAASGRARELAALERRLAAAGWAVDAAGVLIAGATSAAVVAAALSASVDGVLVGVLAVGTLAAVEASLALVTAARQHTELRTGLRRVADLLDPPPLEDRSGDTPTALRDVTVRYRPGGPPALDGVSLELPPGHRIGIVGPSGAGKSTLLRVLAESAAPSAVGGLLADAHVFHATVRENLALGRAGATDDDLAAACATAGLLDWVREQPDGWDTVVGEDGGQLSGGQRQRLALARAVLLDPAVLVLDEPTEGLDPSAADRVLAAVVASARATVVLVTHRLRGLADFDHVVVLDNGRVVQQGRHAELVEAPGWYRDQWLAQETAERGYLSAA
ncbi:thiol reductant ABC exporter subunit CydC [Phytohabitans aurantiacus]|uniref:Thiol reductant ABC exporter subunit CydC n=1 Tax=Phytohabitans aurantiacus TaxID=3016789 RepID=A0ABQ5QVP8_9ACTN|nr:thiol reductant ABC exporter subunit CydC [Phytohabitans aurantiacus]